MVQKTKGKRAPKKTNPLFESRPRNLGPGGDVRPKRDLTRYVRWPKYITIQRQKRVLMSRLKVPGPINQFRSHLEAAQHNFLFKLLNKYKTESKADRITRAAEKKAKPEQQLEFGLNRVTYLVESGKAKLVAIAGDVDPVELVLWLPQLCAKMGVAYCIVRSKAELGKLVHRKTASCVALTGVRKEDQADLDTVANAYKTKYNSDAALRKRESDGKLGIKSQHKLERVEKVQEQKEIQKAK
ncbi:60S ribosomal protein L7a-like [Hippocampus zosterae]|uniref:60S ribosomal protein L7a-like n=1 Tax=Hippocampus zosterae TaxID=109293 RepID=UPI00223CDBB7|nr:60S ribosomal protein L7a-like [Hippocampus zosterae]